MKNQYLSFKVIHIAMCLGILIFLLVAVYISNKGGFTQAGESLTNSLKIASLLSFVILLPLAYWIFISKVKYIKTLTNRDHKLQAFGLAMLIKLALIEGPCLFSIVAYMLTSNMIILAVALAGLLIMASNFPSNAKVEEVIDAANE